MSNAELSPQSVVFKNGVRPLLTVEETRALREELDRSLETVFRPWLERKAAKETIHHLPRRLANLHLRG